MPVMALAVTTRKDAWWSPDKQSKEANTRSALLSASFIEVRGRGTYMHGILYIRNVREIDMYVRELDPGNWDI